MGLQVNTFLKIWKMGAFVDTNPLKKAIKWSSGSQVYSQ